MKVHASHRAVLREWVDRAYSAFVIVCLVAPIAVAGFAVGRWALPPPASASDVFFAPGPECREAAVRVIAGARRRVRLSAYTLSAPRILEALREAHDRGVDVEVLLDRVNEHRSAAEMVANGIPVFLDVREPINHEKMVTADGEVTILGSANWSPSSERDHEVCVVAHDAGLSGKVEADWAKHAAHATTP